MITWKDTINLIIQTYDCTQKKLADLLGTVPSVLSKAKNGERDLSEYFDIDNEYSFESIFGVNKAGSLAYGKDENELLENMKEFISRSFRDIEYGMADYGDEKDYKTYIKKLLKRTRRPVEGSKNNECELSYGPPEEPFLLDRDNELGNISEISELHYNLPGKPFSLDRDNELGNISEISELHYNLPGKPILLGRHNELSKISKIFESSNYVVLTGIDGIGKSQLALSYAYTLNAKGDWTVRHIICEDSETLPQALCKLQFADFPEDKYLNSSDEVISRLKTNKQNVLIVLDNLNHPFSDIDYKLLRNLAECNVRILMTSRYSLISKDKRCLVNISSLDDDLLLKLYEYYRFEDALDHSNYIRKNKTILKRIFSLVGNHTLTITLLAKLPELCFLDEHEILKIMETGQPLPAKRLNVELDKIFIKDTVYEIIKRLFDISKLSEQETVIMRCMTLVPNSGIKIDLFQNLIRCAERDIINLKKGQWIFLDEGNHIMRLHPVICEAILAMDATKEFWRTTPFHSNLEDKDFEDHIVISEDSAKEECEERENCNTIIKSSVKEEYEKREKCVQNKDYKECKCREDCNIVSEDSVKEECKECEDCEEHKNREDCNVANKEFSKCEPDDAAIEKLVFTFENKFAGGFIREVLKKRRELKEGSPDWHTLNKIMASFLAKIAFRNICDFQLSDQQTTCNILDCVEDEYRNSLLMLNKCMINYITDTHGQ